MSESKLRLALRGLAFVGAFALFTLSGLYMGQNKLIYPTSLPYQHPHQNPEGYRHPGERGLPYKDISAKSGDSVTIKGWYIYQKRPLSHPTVVFMHENAGNIGLRLDYFEMLYR